MTTTQDLTASQVAASEAFMPTMRALVRTYQAFLNYSEQHIRELGLTGPQFDVIATLGNTPGMNMRQIADKTLVTKGTITGIIDRLEKKGLVERRVPPENRRCFIITLTPKGKELFERVFPMHIQYVKHCFEQLDEEALQQLAENLNKLEIAFRQGNVGDAIKPLEDETLDGCEFEEILNKS